MARCLNCIHCDVCDTDRCEKERLYGQCSNFLHDDDVVPKSEVVKEIFEEIEQEIAEALKSNYRVLEAYDDGRCNEYILELVNRVKGKIAALRGIDDFIDELEMKYTR